MKKLLLFALLCTSLSSLAVADNLDMHLGIGYHLSFFANLPTSSNDTESTLNNLIMPLGFASYIGIGYGFGSEKLLNLGIEFAPSLDFAAFPNTTTNITAQGRVYVKLKFDQILTTTIFAGYGMNIANTNDYQVGTPVAGARITFLMFYAEYAMNFTPNFHHTLKNEQGIGIAILQR